MHPYVAKVLFEGFGTTQPGKSHAFNDIFVVRIGLYRHNFDPQSDSANAIERVGAKLRRAVMRLKRFPHRVFDVCVRKSTVACPQAGNRY
jgi:hypothetical protein